MSLAPERCASTSSIETIRIIGASASSASGFPVRSRNLQAEIDVFADFLLQNIGGFVGGAVIFDQRLANFLRARANQLDFALQKKTEAIDRIDIERIAHRHDQAGFADSRRGSL